MTDKTAGHQDHPVFQPITDSAVTRITAITHAHARAQAMIEAGVLSALCENPVTGRCFAYQGAERVARTYVAVGIQQHPAGGVILHAIEVGRGATATLPFMSEAEARDHLFAFNRG